MNGLPFPQIPVAFFIGCSTDFCHSEWDKMKFQSCLDVHFPNCWGWWTFGRYFLAIYLLLLLKILFRSQTYFSNVSFLTLGFWVLCICWILVFYQMYNWQRLSHFVSFLFIWYIDVFNHEETFLVSWGSTCHLLTLILGTRSFIHKVFSYTYIM